MKRKQRSLFKKTFFFSLILPLVLVFGFSDRVFAGRIVDENFEGTGYEESWTEDASSGCTVDEDAAVPGTAPPGAGSQCLNATVVNGTYDEAYAYQARADGVPVSYVRGYLYLDQEGLNGGNFFITLGLYTGGGQTVTRLLIGEIGGGLKMRFEYYDGGLKHPENDQWGTPLDVDMSLNTWYRVEYKYDTTPYGGWEFRVNGNAIDAGSLSTTRTPKTMLIGIMHNNGPGSTTLHTDLVVWGTSDWAGEESNEPTTHYVDRDTGNDNWDPYPKENPANTIDAAVDYCASHSGKGTIYVKNASSGYGIIYMENNIDVIGTDENWVPSDAPDYSDCPTVGGVVFSGSDCTVRGFEIYGSGFYSVSINGAYITGVAVKGCKIHGAASGIRLGGHIGATIEGCDISGGLGGMPSDTMYSSGCPIVIKDNVIHDLARAGIEIGGDTQDNGNFEITIQGNDIYNCDFTGIRLIDLGSGCDVTIDNNNIYNNGWDNYQHEPHAGAGMYIRDVSSAVIMRNDIYGNHMAGVCVEGNSDLTIGADMAASDPFTYGNDIHGNYAGVHTGCEFGEAVNGELVIRGNYIYNNTGGSSEGAGIYFGTPVLSATISQNEITQNQLGGIGVRWAHPSAETTLVISKNNIHDNIMRGGIHTGNKQGNFSNPGNFTADSTIKQNKVHHHSNANYGGGIDVRHFKGTIKNNLVYRNSRGGIRFGPFVTEIINNTVVNNGNSTQDRGGGIIYDDYTDNVTVNEPPTGTLTSAPLIGNNISAYNEKAGIRVGGNGYACPADNPAYDYNMLYANYPWNDVFSRANAEDCGWPDLNDMSCTQQQYGGCGAHFGSGIVLNNPNDVMADPSFVDMASDDYHLTSPLQYLGDDGGQRGAYGGSDPMVDSEIPEF